MTTLMVDEKSKLTHRVQKADARNAKVKERRSERRRARLEAVAPTRICPYCNGGPFLQSKAWVTSPSGEAACRSCFNRCLVIDRSTGKFVARVDRPASLTKGTRLLWVVDARAVRLARLHLAMTQERLAQLIGKSHAFVRSLERKDTLVHELVKQKLEDALK